MLDAIYETEPAPQRVVEVGWALDIEKGGIIYAAPKRLGRKPSQSEHAKALNRCPAINDFDARHFEVACPFDIDVAFVAAAEGREPQLRNAAGAASSVRGQHLGRVLTLVRATEWRHPGRPILQLALPYLFFADEPCWINQLPPFMAYSEQGPPGLMLSGRFPVHIWPRPLIWAFEWHQPERNLVLRRGQPLFYLRFETNDASRHVRLVEAEITPEVRDYVDSVSTVANYVGQTFSLFATAQERRPARLVVPKARRPGA